MSKTVTNAAADDELHRLIPEGLATPTDIAPEIFKHAVRTFLEPRRVDMGVLAKELGIARRTFYRRVRDRNHLLGEIHWYNSRVIFADALATTADLRGVDRVVAVYEHSVNAVNGSPPILMAMQDEAENTLRILTTKHGPVHGRVVGFMQRLLALEQRRGHLNIGLPLDALAFAIVRMGESFLYAHFLTGEEPDVRFSMEMVRRLLGAEAHH